MHYLADRPVVAAIEPQFSVRRLDEAGAHALMRQYRSRYLVVFPGAPADRVPEQASNVFLQGVASGAAPEWLTLAASARDVAIYECATCAQ